MLPMPKYWRQSVYRRLPELIQKFGPTFLLYNKQGIVETSQKMKAAFRQIPFRQYYAFKALPEPFILEFMIKELGFGSDCSSIPEFLMSKALGATGREDIIYSSNDTNPKDFPVIDKYGGMLNLDDITFVPQVPVFPKRIFFRINSGNRLTTQKGNVIGDPCRAKYGITYSQIVPAYRAAMLRGATEFGIHIMICSNDLRASHFVDTARFTLEVAAMLYRRLGIRISHIDIGGGFGIPYRPKDWELNLYWIGQKISKLFLDFAGQFGWLPVLMTECGRYVTGPHGILVNPVLHVMQKYRHFIGVAAAMTGCPRPAFYGAYHHADFLNPNGNLRRGPRHFTNIVGPMCEDWDRLTAKSSARECPKCGHTERKNGERLLPWSIREGDISITGNCAAHSSAMGGNYNWQLLLMALFDQDGTNENTIMIRRAQTMEDLTRTIILPPGVREKLKRMLKS
jgi:diaminopimelate decarboxylase